MKHSENTYAKEGHLTLETMSSAVWYNAWTVKKFERYLTGDILEAGCGHGSFTKTLATYGNVWAIDIDATCISTAKNQTRNIARVGYGDIENGSYFFKHKQFDTIVCINVLEHIKNDTRTLTNLSRLTKKGGHLILLVPAHQFLYGTIDRAIDHYRRYEIDSLTKHLLDAGYEVQFRRRLNLLGAIGWFVSGRIFKNSHIHTKRLKLFNMIAPFILPIEDIVQPPVGTSLLFIAKKK